VVADAHVVTTATEHPKDGAPAAPLDGDEEDLTSSPLLALLTELVSARSIQAAGKAILRFAEHHLDCDTGVVGLRERMSPMYEETVWLGVTATEIGSIRDITRASETGLNPVEIRLQASNENAIHVTEETIQLLGRPLVDSFVIRLALDDVSIGTVLIARSQGELFQQHEIDLMLLASEHLGHTMARLRLIDDQQREHARLTAMLEAVKAQTEEEELTDYLARLAEIAGSTIHADTVDLYAYDEARSKTIAAGHFGRHKERSETAFVKRETLPPTAILAERMMLEDARPRFRSQRDLAEGDYSAEDPLWTGDLLIPFLSRSGVEGIAYVGRSGLPPTFTSDEVAFLLSLGQQAGTSIERQRARDEARLRGHHLEALNRLGASFSRSLDLETVCQGIYDEILTFTRLDRFAVALTEDDDGRISMPFAMEEGRRVSGDQSALLPPAHVRHALREGGAVVSRLAADPESAQVAGAWYCVIAPMMRDNHAFGVLALQRRSAEGFTPDERQTIETIALQSAAAVENARLYGHVSAALLQAGAREESLRAIVRLASVVSTEPDQDDMMASFARELNQLMPSYYVAILLHEPSRRVFRWMYRFAGGALIDPGTVFDEMPEEQGIAGSVFWSGVPERVNYANFDARWWGRLSPAEGFSIEHMMASPLIIEGEDLGVFVVIRRDSDPYTDEEFAVFQVVAELVAGMLRGISLLGQLSIERDAAKESAGELADALMIVNAERAKAEKQSAAIGRVLDASFILSSLHDPEKLVRTAARIATEIVPSFRVAIMLPWWGYTDSLSIVKFHAGAQSPASPGDDWDSEFLRETVLSRQPIRLNRVEQDRRFAFGQGSEQFPAEQGVHLICVPLDAGKAFAGALAMTRSGGDPFTDDEFTTVQLFAAQLSAALANANLMARNHDLLVSGIRALVSAVDAKDAHTGGHSERVAAICRLIATEMALPHSDVETIELAALLHDIGKIGVPDAILHKPGRLTEAERVIMMRHAANGADMLVRARSDTMVPLAPLVRHHHEWFNGQGYPDGLSGADIPIGAAIIAVADAYDTMISDRPYRQRGTPDEAMAELRLGAGGQFHPQVVDVIGHLLAANLLQSLFDETSDQVLSGSWEPMASLAARSAPLGDAMALRLLVDMVPMTRLIVDTETFFQQVTDLVQRTLDYPRVALYLIDQSMRKLARAALSSVEPETGGFVQPLDGGIRGAALLEGLPRRTPVVVDDPAFDPAFDPVGGSMLLAPLEADEQVIGLLAVESDDERAFSQGDLSVLVAVASQVASAINVARLHAEAKRASLTDELTGVGNHRAFWSTLEGYVESATPFAMIMMDVEGLKRVNDTEGHLAGDALLRLVARIIREVARPGDTVARLGGDEFATIMPGIDAGAATRMGASIRRRVGLECERVKWPSTVRYGVAVTGDDGDTASKVVSAADQRLYAMRASTMSASRIDDR
jgi:diguanylate cyclase (GGDEF)-like protein